MDTSPALPGFRGLLAAAIFGGLALSFSGVSAAASSSVSVNVKFADLDLSKPPGALVLYNRIRAAAQGACSYYWFKTDADEARCVHDAIANAVIKANRAALFAVYNAKNSTPLPTALVSQSR
jgi:UrcA family protein